MILPTHLYHGTPVENAASILAQGLLPRCRAGEEGVMNGDVVSLGEALALIFATKPTTPHPPALRSGIVVEVEMARLDLCLLRPFSGIVLDYLLSNPDAELDTLLAQSQNPATDFRAMVDRRYFAGEWSGQTHALLCLQSLRVHQEVFFAGLVPPDAFSRVLWVSGAVEWLPSFPVPRHRLITDSGEKVAFADLDFYMKRLFDEQGVTPQEARRQLAQGGR